MKRVLVGVVLALVMIGAGYLLRGVVAPIPTAPNVPTVATSVDFIRQMVPLQALRASVKEIVTSKVGEASSIAAPGKLAVICHFDIKYTYDMSKASIVAGRRDDGTRYCMIRLPRHECEVATKGIRPYDEQDGTWLEFTRRTPAEEQTRVLDAARQQAEKQARGFLGDMEGEAQASARSTVTQIARAFGYSDVQIEFQK